MKNTYQDAVARYRNVDLTLLGIRLDIDWSALTAQEQETLFRAGYDIGDRILETDADRFGLSLDVRRYHDADTDEGVLEACLQELLCDADTYRIMFLKDGNVTGSITVTDIRDVLQRDTEVCIYPLWGLPSGGLLACQEKGSGSTYESLILAEAE